jgi:hypothetical protein
MSSFYQENQHYIKLKLIGEMRNLAPKEKVQKYNSFLATETRTRLKTHYKKLSTSKQKIDFFSEVIDYLKDFEFSLILFSIYFDIDAGKIFRELSQKVIASQPSSFLDQFGILKFLKSNPASSLIEDHMLDLFLEHLKLKVPSNQVQSSRNELSNPEANKFSEWIFTQLQDKNSGELTLSLFLHFSKYWNHNHSANYSKGVVLLTKMEKAIFDMGFDKLKINLKEVIQTVRLQSREVICPIVVVPFLDSVQEALERDKRVINGYINKLNDFSALLNKTEIFFKDFTSLSLIELFHAHCSQEKYLINVYSEEIRNRTKRGILPTKNELNYFSKSEVFESAKASEWRFSLVEYIIRANYIYY